MEYKTSDEKRKMRVLMAKPGIDTHWRGAFVIAQALRDAGMEVIYTGTYKSPEMVLNMAIEEDVDVIAMSFMGGSHVPLSREIVKLVKEKEAEDICLIAGGIIRDSDKEVLQEMGISGLYGPGTPLDLIVGHIAQRIRRERWNQPVCCKECAMFSPTQENEREVECNGTVVSHDTEVTDCLDFRFS
ncbi:MAG: cobalamin B12-binding domain-containing protein [Thermodesulfobacteriota bacterium]|nr:cobalamin B12-binding domain-containing protein [Thermodesulfobacteriota bacterium]